MIVFGPIPSRRLGRSMGINNIPPKHCPYSCVYCQLGSTQTMSVERREFYSPDFIMTETCDKIEKIVQKNELIDYLSFVPDGEPTLDTNLGKTIKLLKQTGVKIAVISNASLIWDKEVRAELMEADWVSLKIDAIDKATWRKINRPHKELDLKSIQRGIIEFASEFKGELVTETMLVQGYNTETRELHAIADLIYTLSPGCSYISIPFRPPADRKIVPADEESVAKAYDIFSQRIGTVECLVGHEGNAFAFTGNVIEDILSITAVHPMREESVIVFLKKAKAGWDVVESLLREKRLAEVEYGNTKFYIRSFK